MARKRKGVEMEDQELNLAPIMNMVMILIPLLLLSTVFMKTGVINVSQPRNAQSNNTETEEADEPTVVPKVVVGITSDGFYISDMGTTVPPEQFLEFCRPIASCPGATTVTSCTGPGTEQQATVCLRSDAAPDASLIDQLDFAALYNQLVEIRLKAEWYDAFGEENNNSIQIQADPTVPFEVVVKTMDAARYFLNGSGSAGVGMPEAGSSATYVLNNGSGATMADFEEAQYVPTQTDGPLVPVDLFPTPVLLLSTSGS